MNFLFIIALLSLLILPNKTHFVTDSKAIGFLYKAVKSDSFSFINSRGLIPMKFLMTNSTIESIYFKDETTFKIDTFIRFDKDNGVCVIDYEDGQSCTYKFILSCKISKNVSPDYLIGGMDCDIDEGHGYYTYKYNIKIPFIKVTEVYHGYKNHKYFIEEKDQTLYSIGADGKFSKHAYMK